MMHLWVCISLIPIRLLFAGGCPACLPFHVGLYPNDVLKLVYARYSIPDDLLYNDLPYLNITRYSVKCQQAG
jgi:hypothetical protein